jgi:carbon-monoxide dehydrogenase small subunit
MELCFTLNGKTVKHEIPENRTLLDLLRVDLGVTSVKKGCENGECGACTVLINGAPVSSCIVLAAQVDGRTVETVDGLENDPVMAALRRAFLEDGAIQCGFCTPGMLVSAYALLRDKSNPTVNEVKKAIEGNLCRCTGYVKIIEAIMDASERVATE